MSDPSESIGPVPGIPVVFEHLKKHPVVVAFQVAMMILVALSYFRPRQGSDINQMKQELAQLQETVRLAPIEDNAVQLKKELAKLEGEVASLSSQQSECCSAVANGSEYVRNIDSRLSRVENQVDDFGRGDNGMNIQLSELRTKQDSLDQRLSDLQIWQIPRIDADRVGDRSIDRRVYALEKQVEQLAKEHEEFRAISAKNVDVDGFVSINSPLLENINERISRVSGEITQTESDLRVELLSQGERITILEVIHHADLLRGSSLKSFCENPERKRSWDFSPPRLEKRYSPSTIKEVREITVVRVCVHINEDGSVARVEEEASLKESLSPLLIKEAKIAAARSSYQPALLNGRPVPWRLIVKVTFEPN